MARGVSVFSRTAVAKALAYAGLEPDDMATGPHPDTGQNCLYLDATIQQWSGFIAAMAARHRTAREISALTEQVQLHIGSEGHTRFWLPGVEVGERWLPGPRRETQ